jgi:hypothetical protein
MRAYSPLENMSLLDVTTLQYGTHESLIALAVANGISITARLDGAQRLLLPEGLIKTNVVQWYDKKGFLPATFGYGLENEGLFEENTDEFPLTF